MKNNNRKDELKSNKYNLTRRSIMSQLHENKSVESRVIECLTPIIIVNC